MTLRLRVGGALGALVLITGSAALVTFMASPAGAQELQFDIPIPSTSDGGPIEETVEAVGDAVVEGGAAAGDAVEDTTDAIGDTVSDTGGQAGDTVSDTGGQAGDAIGGSAGDAVKDTTGSLGDAVKDTTGSLGEAVSDGGTTVGGTVEEASGTVGNSIKGVFGETGSDGASGPGSSFSGFPGVDKNGFSSGTNTGPGSAGASRDLSGLSALANSIQGLDLSGDPLVAAANVPAPLDFGGFLDEAAEAARAFAFPLVLTVIVIAFMVIQGRIDSRDPKLALAAVDQDDELLSFS